MIGRAGIGVDNIDVDAASAAGIVVMNTPFGNAVTTANTPFMICALRAKYPKLIGQLKRDFGKSVLLVLN